MDFASKFVYDIEEEEYECISDDEFHGGMELSCSSSENDSEEETDSAQNRPPKKSKTKLGHHWRTNEKAPLRNTDRLPAKRWFRRADTNVVSVSFDTLMSPCSMHAGDPVSCETCHAILSCVSKPSGDGGDMVWRCEFCGNSMKIDIVPEEIPVAEEVTFLMEPGKATSASSLSGRDESLVVFCVDTSGSMCVTSEVAGRVQLRGTSQLQQLDPFNLEGGSQYLPSQRNHNVTYVSRLQAMQAAVEHQLGEMAKDFPHRRVAIVTFSNDVTILGDGFQEEITVAGDKLLDMEQLSQIGSKVTAPQAIQKTCKKLGDKVYRLEEGGATALGPALVVAINMASSCAGSKVIVCTDGKANVGLGNLEDESDNDAGVEFYTNVGNAAVSKGVSVSVTTIQGTDCKLVHLGQLASKTGGQVNIVDPLNLTKEFGNILADQIIATNVKSKFIVHKALYIVDEKDPRSRKCLAEFSPGNVQTSTTITFEFARKNAKEKKARKGKDDDGKTEGAAQAVYDNTKEEAEGGAVYDKTKEEAEGGAVYDNKTPNTEASASNPEEDMASAIVVHHPPEDTPTQGVSQHTAPQRVLEDEPAVAVSEYPFQLQIEYTDTEGTKALRVITRSLPATADRQVAESNVNLQVLGSHAAKSSADLALQGEYSRSRGKALMNQRLAWRTTHSSDASREERSAYHGIYSRIKTMENRLQRKQTQEIMTRGCTYSDDEDFEEAMNDEIDQAGPVPARAMMHPGRPPLPARTSRKTKFSERSVGMEDSLYEMVYEMHRTNQRSIYDPAVEGNAPSSDNSAPLPDSSAPVSDSSNPPLLPERIYSNSEANGSNQ